MPWIITTLVCLWAIVLEVQLRRRDKHIDSLVDAVNAVALGKAKLGRKNDKTVITYNKRGA